MNLNDWLKIYNKHKQDNENYHKALEYGYTDDPADYYFVIGDVKSRPKIWVVPKKFFDNKGHVGNYFVSSYLTIPGFHEVRPGIFVTNTYMPSIKANDIYKIVSSMGLTYNVELISNHFDVHKQ